MTRKTRKTRTRKTTASVVPADFRARYAEHGGSVGDALALRLKKHLATGDDTTDIAKLRALAEANGVWKPEYAKLNAGLARMTVGNRLRALARNGNKIAW